MNKIQINDRINLLYLSLQFCTDQIKTFTVGERICINQERFQWLHILSNPEAEPRLVSVVIEEKIEQTKKLIAMYNYKPIHQNPFDFEKTETEF
ncbi:hypothetical protein [Flavobacterium chilense]|uniref:Uncharacterized protein n=1 Tax=Flavobacterium chilense TaxID=946677 RepID=A0A1M7ERL0_9FLAO|nr:hypothetical protein [Flavobacterium chilense]SHL94327.1 hypothetical protein SAMN05444484_10343 [Flavobacterium chilense]